MADINSTCPASISGTCLQLSQGFGPCWGDCELDEPPIERRPELFTGKARRVRRINRRAAPTGNPTEDDQ